MDETLRNALEQRDAARRQVAAWDAFIEAYRAQLREQAAEAGPKGQGDLFVERPLTRTERATAVKAMMDDAERLIIEAGHPLTRGRLLELLQAAGHRVEGRDKSKVLGTNLWRSQRFHNLEGVGYWPRSQPIPESLTGHRVRDTSLS